ncbi:alanine racemase [Myxococcota bacterium]|nr:alanine racemase [Myxococcota bacterium]
MELTWIEVDVPALVANVAEMRRLVGPGAVLAPAVKGNGYGHGLVLAARAFLRGGADWLSVNALYEARALRQAGMEAPLYAVGYVARDDLEEALSYGLRMVVYNFETVEALARLRRPEGAEPARLHLKLETGNHRQGIEHGPALELARRIASTPGLVLEGVASHFANVEDTTDHGFARSQVARFRAFCEDLESRGIRPRYRHISNSAATILWPDVHFNLVRCGIACYGMWPSPETRVSAHLEGRGEVRLRPALTWKARIAQVKEVPAGAYVGYGCTYRTTHASRLAVLPVGYYDGYDRSLSNLAHVLVRGQRAPVRGRVAMNTVVVDVTHVGGVEPEKEAVLLGAQGEETVTAEQVAQWAGTINYEVTTRIHERIPRIPVGE